MSTTRGHFEGLFDKLPVRPDRRARPRKYSHRLAYVQLGDENGGIALNLSEGGLAITTAEMLTSDYFPSIRFQLPRSDVWMEARGEVAWASSSKKEAGIQFVDLADSDREKIREWIANNDSAQGQMRGTSEDTRERDMESLGMRGASKRPMKDRKLEVLSEADEAKFAGMFPSEKSLTNVHEDEALTQDAELRISEQNPRNVLRFSEQSLRRGELVGTSRGIERIADEPTQAKVTPALLNDSHSVEEETPPPPNFPEENSLLVSRLDASCEDEQPRIGESELAQPKSSKAGLTHNNSAETESLEPAAFPRETPVVAAGAVETSEIGKAAAGGRVQEAPNHVLSRETDLIQQLELHRRNRAANLLLDQEREVAVERRSGWLLAAVVLLIAIICFAVGVGVGNGFFDKFLGRGREAEQQSDAKPTNLPAATAGENDFAGGSAVAGNAQRSAEGSPGGSTVAPTKNVADGAASDSPADTKADAPVQATPTGAASTKSRDGANLAAKDTNSSNDASGSFPGNSLSSDASASGGADEPRAQPGTAANSAAEAEPARPFSEIQAPILVTAPDERSGPFRLALTEQAVSASLTLAISAQRFVWVPAQAGPASNHRPERLQVGVLIFHVDPLTPSGNQKELAGTVKVRATVGKSGDVLDVQPISGPALLIPAVVRAVREWRYTVTLLDGQPLATEEEVVVEFRPKS
jgi:hypothetical protein